ncbi:MAG: hypothetical protein JW795_09690 [Chitinivibrionales bacterium]|nr:hypothetical protein [Chitinivibrionales bacterium]
MTKIAPRLKELEQRKIHLIGDLLHGGSLSDEALIENNGALFSDRDCQTLVKLVKSKYLNSYPYAVVINCSKACMLFSQSETGSEEQRLKDALTLSRISLMGTDGIRGKISFSLEHNCIVDLLTANAFTPQLVECCCLSYARLLLDAKVLTIGDSVVIGDDGRDWASAGKMKNAVVSGFTRANVDVYDCGVVPTALVPYTMLRKHIRAGAMLTASHNPANQNGIKFFIDGRKLLPEGAIGDYTLAAYIYEQYRSSQLPKQMGHVTMAQNLTTEADAFLRGCLPANTRASLKGTTIVFDSANGASTAIGASLMESLGLAFVSVNEKPTGDNINKNCGVAELEGHDHFKAAAYETATPFIRKIFDTGRKNSAGSVFGIALDGDGDRGFVLYFDKKEDVVHVLDGDKCGYILAAYFLLTKTVNPENVYFITTIESDLMVSTTAAKQLGCATAIVSVGDKWICNFTKGPVLLGLEVSGHVMFPVEVTTEKGATTMLLSGIGMLTGLLTLVAIRQMKLPREKIINPFNPGAAKTFYVFFVDKTKFYRDSTQWRSDMQLITDAVAAGVKDKTMPSDTTVTFESKEDPNVLYATLRQSGEVAGCIFVRNSGTEDKIATYVKGTPAAAAAFIAIGNAINEGHIAAMKNEQRIEFRVECSILKLLQSRNQIAFGDVQHHIQQEITETLAETDLFNVLYGLKKEGRILFENQQIKTIG